MMELDQPMPEFASPADEIAYWRTLNAEYKMKLLEVNKELEEFQENSKELESELEYQLEQSDKKNRELLAVNSRLQMESESLKTKLEKCHLENCHKINELQDELNHIKTIKDELQKYIRELEQCNDDLERAKRTTVVSLEDFEARMNEAIERNAFLESELDEKEAMAVTVQRLKDEARDLRSELQSKDHVHYTSAERENDKNLKSAMVVGVPIPIPIVDSNKLVCDMEIQTTPGSPLQNHSSSVGSPLTPSARISALNIVGDLLRKVGALESKLASCRSYVKDNPRTHGSKLSPHNSPRAKRVNRGAASNTHGHVKIGT